MKQSVSRRQFVQATAIAGAGLALPKELFAAKKKSVLIFTKSSGFEHEVIKVIDGRPSILEQAVKTLSEQHGFEVTATKDGRVFDSPDFRKKYSAVLFYTTLDLTKAGKDGNPPMSPAGKQALLDAIHGGLGFVGVHAAADTFHTEPDPEDLSNRYIAHGENEDPYLKMLGGEFITHGRDPRLQAANLIVKDPKFPGLEGVTSPVNFNEEWYSLKDFVPDIHVILALDTARHERRALPARSLSRNLGPDARQGTRLLYRHGRPPGKLVERIFPESAGRRNSLVHRRCQSVADKESRAGHARLRRDSAEVSSQDVAIRAAHGRKYLLSNLTGRPCVRLTLGMVRAFMKTFLLMAVFLLPGVCAAQADRTDPMIQKAVTRHGRSRPNSRHP